MELHNRKKNKLFGVTTRLSYYIIFHKKAICNRNEKNRSGKVKHELRVQIHKLRVQIHELRVQIHELLVQIHELLVQIHELRVQIHELLFKSTNH